MVSRMSNGAKDSSQSGAADSNRSKGNNGDKGNNSPHAAASVFDDLEALRLSPEDAATVGSREILSRVPVRKPSRVEFFRVHPDPSMQLTTGVFIDR
jgi:hypothetical protein